MTTNTPDLDQMKQWLMGLQDAICAEVERVVSAGRPRLLEFLAQALADAVMALDPRVDSVTVAVRKLRPPVPQPLATSGVRIHRSREDQAVE